MSSGTSDQRDKAVEEVENDKLGGEDYSDNFEEGEEEEEEGEVDDENPDDNDTEQPARPSAPVWCKLKKENCESMNERLLQGGVVFSALAVMSQGQKTFKRALFIKCFVKVV